MKASSLDSVSTDLDDACGKRSYNLSETGKLVLVLS